MFLKRHTNTVRALYAWELGANMGYVRPALPLLEYFQHQGASVLAAVKNTAANSDVLHQAGLPSVQAPVNMSRIDGSVENVWNYIDLLQTAGFGHAPTLIGLVHGWRGLYELFGATVAVAHHAPSAMLAARTMHLPAQRFGTGFACPPDGSLSKCFLPWVSSDQGLTNDRAVQILDNINHVLRTFGANEVSSIETALGSTLDASHDWIMGYPGLDHYSDRNPQTARYVGTVSPSITLQQPEASSIVSGFDGVFAYVHPDFPDIAALVESLKRVAKLGIKVAVFASGIGETTLRNWRASAPASFSVLQNMVPLLEMLSQARLMVSHGSHGVTCAALLAGVPCLVFPRNADQWMLGAALERLGAGKAHTGKLNAASATKLINEAMTSSALRNTAKKFAEGYAATRVHKTKNEALTPISDLWQIMRDSK
jgi:hypothetical protein